MGAERVQCTITSPNVDPKTCAYTTTIIGESQNGVETEPADGVQLF